MPVKELASRFPGSLYEAHNLIDLDKNKFTKFVSCPGCGKLHNYTDAIYFDKKQNRTSVRHAIIFRAPTIPS